MLACAVVLFEPETCWMLPFAPGATGLPWLKERDGIPDGVVRPDMGLRMGCTGCKRAYGWSPAWKAQIVTGCLTSSRDQIRYSSTSNRQYTGRIR